MKEQKSFRPLAGIMVLITELQQLMNWSKPSFRPLAGIMVLIAFALVGHSEDDVDSFRPLAGIMVLISFERLILVPPGR